MWIWLLLSKVNVRLVSSTSVETGHRKTILQKMLIYFFEQTISKEYILFHVSLSVCWPRQEKFLLPGTGIIFQSRQCLDLLRVHWSLSVIHWFPWYKMMFQGFYMSPRYQLICPLLVKWHPMSVEFLAFYP